MYKKPQKQTENIRDVISVNFDKSQIDIIDLDRIDHLKSAINKGRYTINSGQVAEKFIQFETLLSA